MGSSPKPSQPPPALHSSDRRRQKTTRPRKQSCQGNSVRWIGETDPGKGGHLSRPRRLSLVRPCGGLTAVLEVPLEEVDSPGEPGETHSTLLRHVPVFALVNMVGKTRHQLVKQDHCTSKYCRHAFSKILQFTYHTTTVVQKIDNCNQQVLLQVCVRSTRTCMYPPKTTSRTPPKPAD